MTVTLELGPEEVTILRRRAEAEDEMDDPEELAERDREREEVEANLNRWRAEQGRPLADRGGRPGINSANEENPWVEMVEGVRRRTTVSGRAMSQMVVTLEAGRHLPEHRHPQEQIVHVIRGRLRVNVGGVGQEVGAGESLYMAGDVMHSVDVLAEALVVDTFSPPREDLLAQDREAQGQV